MASQQVVDELVAKINQLEQYNLANLMPDPRGSEYPNRTLAKVLLDMESYVVTLKHDPPLQKSTIDDMVESKLKTAIAMSKGSFTQEKDPHYKSVLESKAFQDIGAVVDAKQ